MINGVDDLLAAVGPERVLDLFEDAQPPPEDTQESQAKTLIALAGCAQLFRTPQGEAYARLSIQRHREIWMLRSKGFRQWLVREFFRKKGKPPGTQALQDAISYLEAKAHYDAPEKTLHIRVAGQDRKIYLDLCNDEWEVIEISADDWHVLTDSPVHFRRPNALRPLPKPVRGGSPDRLREFINVGGKDNWILCACWLAMALRPTGPYPLLILQGEQGSAKSTTARLLRRLVDPSIAPVRTPPRDERDLLIAASNSWMIAYDNLSGVPVWLSDALCRLATGGGFSTRQLYTDSDEVLFDAMRPVILNGIDQIAERADLADRSVILNLPRIAESERKEEAHLQAEFERALPEILGALLSAVSAAIRCEPTVVLVSKPRMADFARWATAAEPGFGFEAGSFLKTYGGNRSEAVKETLESDPVSAAIIAWLEAEPACWNGSCRELLAKLALYVDDSSKRSKSWPQSPAALSNRLRRLASFLRECEIHIVFERRGTGGRRTVSISKNESAIDRH